MGEHVGHRGEHGEPRAPPRLAVAGAEVDAGPHDVASGHTLGKEPEHGFGRDERDALLESLLQPVEQVTGAIRIRVDHDRDPAIIDLDRIGADVVGPRVERSARAQVEAGVVPVARQQAALDGPTVQREAHVRAPVVDRERPAIAPEDTDRLGAGLPGEAPRLLQLVQRPDGDAIDHGEPLPVAGPTTGLRRGG